MAKLTPVKAIRAKCRDCCADNVAEVRRCHIVDCALHEYRMGKRPPKPDKVIEMPQNLYNHRLATTSGEEKPK